MTERIYLFLAIVAGLVVFLQICKRLPIEKVGAVTSVTSLISLVVITISSLANWIVAGSIDWTFQVIMPWAMIPTILFIAICAGKAVNALIAFFKEGIVDYLACRR